MEQCCHGAGVAYFDPSKMSTFKQASIEEAFGVGRVLDTVSVKKSAVHSEYGGTRPAPGQVAFVDLFCGIGGFSQGCRQAGQVVVLAVDCCMQFLDTHAENHPACKHVCMKLGRENEERLVRFVRDASTGFDALHVHGSPPCQNLSLASATTNSRDNAVGMELVDWFLSLVLRLRPRSWSLEQVPVKCVKERLGRFKDDYPELCDFRVVCAEQYAIPQRRHRLIAGTPRVIKRLDDCALPQTAALVSMASVVDPPPQAVFMMASWGKHPDPVRTHTRHSVHF